MAILTATRVFEYRTSVRAMITAQRNVIYDTLAAKLIDVHGAVFTDLCWPPPNSRLHPQVLYYHEPTDTLYAGLDDELWRVTSTGTWEYVVTTTHRPTPPGRYNIRRIAHDGTKIVIFCWRNWWQPPYEDAKTEPKTEQAAAYVLEADDTLSWIATYTYFWSGQMCWRQSAYINNQYNWVGQFSSIPGHPWYAGENIPVPFPQWMSARTTGEATLNRLYETGGILDKAWTSGPIFEFAERTDRTPPAGRRIWATGGWYKMNSALIVGAAQDQWLSYTFGQNGFVEWNPGTNRWAYYKIRDGSSLFKVYEIDSAGSEVGTDIRFESTLWQIFCGDIKSDGTYYLGTTLWQEFGEDVLSYGHLSVHKLNSKVADWDKAYYWDGNLLSESDETVAWNAGTSTVAVKNVGDMMYFGKTSTRFSSIYFNVTATDISSVSWVLEYYDGGGWTALTPIESTSWTPTAVATETLIWAIPTDWATVVLVFEGTARYWIRIRITGIICTNGATVAGAQCNWWFFWESQLQSASDYSKVPLELRYNSFENSLHGCFLDKSTLQWHYFIWDIANNTMYQTQNVDGSSHASFQFKSHLYHTKDRYVYCVATDPRYQERNAFLVRAFLDAGGPSLTNLGEARADEYGSRAPLTQGRRFDIYGITGQAECRPWLYSRQFYPRIKLLKPSAGTLRQMLEHLLQALNFQYRITADRDIRLFARDSLQNERELDRQKLRAVGQQTPSRHFYDGIKISWTEPQPSERSGEITRGDVGWDKRILSISNPFIQDSGLAEALAVMLLEYFGRQRFDRKVDGTFLVQFDLSDGITLRIPSKYNVIDPDKEWAIAGIEMNWDQRAVVLNVTERKD